MKSNIKVYTSFESQNNDEIAYSLSLTPAQRIAETVALIKRVYGYKEGANRAKHIKVVFYQSKE